MVHQRVHARPVPNWSVRHTASPASPPALTWQVPVDPAHTFPRFVHPHSVLLQTNTNGGREAAWAVPAHSHQSTAVILISAANVPAGPLGASRGA